ncbi:eIF2A-related protein [Hyalangium versicolor]|uniref:WD40 domain-containing protein n=1 Tax=Hyalangium versicolor TaxID=2861190 RepID=UPI001CCEC084|nr:TIR domain-containing protein [Hyalangium versicolor]
MIVNLLLFGEALRSAAGPWRDELGKSDRERLDKLLGLAVTERFRLSDCLQALFPGEEQRKAQTALTSFRKRINDASQGEGRADLGLRFHVDTKKQNPPEERFCWFTGPDPAMRQAERYSDQVTADIQGKPFVPAQGIATTGSAMASNKKVVRFFVSYAHDNKALVDALVKELRTHFASSARYEVHPWIDHDILLGERWRESIAKAISDCEFGLMLISPAFLASRFIGEKELPHFVGAQDDPRIKPVLPVGLVPVSFDRHDLKGLGEHQLFLFQNERTQGRYYDQMPAGPKRREFIHKLFLAIEKRLDAFFGSPPSGPPPSPRGPEAGTSSKESAAVHVPMPGETKNFQRTRGHRIALGQLERLDTGQRNLAEHVQARDALEELEEWAINPEAPPFFALLGEYGIGKTTTLKQFTRDLLEKRRTRPDLPLPIYVDLRDYVSETRDKDSIPTLEQLLAGVIQSSWKLQDRAITPEGVLRLVREEGALIIFDGLDEKIVHLTPNRARAFIRRLWAVLPDATREARPEGRRRGKLLISCRSHYFRDVLSQNSMLVGEDREGMDRQQFPALCLLPFTEEQIRGYLASFLGGREHATEAFDIIASIHNLRDLAERPYLLSLISGRLRELEELQTRGEKVNAARLYELVVRSWLNRDDGKHQLDVEHKYRLMEALAAALWRDGSKQWDVERLEDWLDEYLAAHPALAQAYANKDRTVLKEDLRTATFVLRPTTEERHFRFAHTSLQEYFLAVYLQRALLEGKIDRWDLPGFSWETLDFLGQLLEQRPNTPALRTLERVLGGESPSAAIMAFAYWLRALEHGYPTPSPTRVNLSGADLESWHLRGLGPTQPLNLRRADLSGVKLNRARVEYVDLTEANLTTMQARQALFLNVSAPRARAREADFSGIQWREGSLAGANLGEVQLAGCQWIRVDRSGTILPDGWEKHATVVEEGQSRSLSSSSAVHAVLRSGHSDSVSACAWSPDGQQLLSGSEDNSLRVWDASSGQCLLILSGHASSVYACAWSPDGQRLLSGSADNSLRVWDAFSGQCLLTLSGHSDSVSACAWSPDGQRLLSGSADNSLRVWDASSGQCLLTLSGHSSSVTACAWSPDGQRLLSGSADNSLRVWDASSGQCLLTLSGHSSNVFACAWSPDGQRLLSGSADNSLRVWDASSGQCLLTLSGHSSRTYACAWSPDGQRLLSGSADKSLRVWDASSGQCLLTLSGHSLWASACAWSPDGQRLLSGSADNSLRVWDASSGQCLLTLSGYSSRITACTWSPDGQRLLSGSVDSSLRVWDASSGQCLLTLSGHSSSVTACAWSPDGQRLLSGSVDSSLRVWDTSSGQCLLTLSKDSLWVSACAWSPDGQRLLSGSADKSLRVWDASSGQCLLTLSGHSSSVSACTWSPDGQWLLSGSEDNSLRVWDASSGQCLLTLSGHSSRITACAWSPDGQRLLSGSADTSLRVWDASSGQCLLTLSGHSSRITACTWSPDSQRMLSGSVDSSLRVWDTPSGQCLLTLSGHSSRITACAWSPDGQRLLSGSADKSLRVWDASSGQCLWSGQVLPENQTASIDEISGRILHASSEAWRWLGWRWTDPATLRLRILPAETFGPLPP